MQELYKLAIKWCSINSIFFLLNLLYGNLASKSVRNDYRSEYHIESFANKARLDCSNKLFIGEIKYYFTQKI